MQDRLPEELALAGIDTVQAAPFAAQTLPGSEIGRRWTETVAALVSLQAAYGERLEALPDATRNTATGEALKAIVDIDLDEISATMRLRPRLIRNDVSTRQTWPHDTLPPRPF